MLHGYSGLYMLLAQPEKGLTEGEKEKQSLEGENTLNLRMQKRKKKERTNLETRSEAVNTNSAEFKDRCLQDKAKLSTWFNFRSHRHTFRASLKFHC